jgi:ketosteroid isomerase-like protein
MTSRRTALLAASSLLSSACSTTKTGASSDSLREQVRESELAFAATMAARDLQSFARFISDDAVFINGGQPLRGKPAILEYWGRFFSGTTAPFSWKPDIVEVAAGGTLGYTEGPVTASSGSATSRFYTTWQRQPQGGWLVVFDNGYRLCP